MIIIDKIFKKIERDIFACNWFNPIATLYLNFRCLRLRHALRFPVFVYGTPRFYSTYGEIILTGNVKTGMIKINKSIPGNSQGQWAPTMLDIWGKVVFKGRCIIGTSNTINVWKTGMLELGENVRITTACNISAYMKVTIGNYTRIAPRSQIFDTNFHYVANVYDNIVGSMNKPVTIGNYCWICNSSTVSPGVTLPDRTILASHSLVKRTLKDIPENSIIGGIPARLLATGYRKIENEKLKSTVWQYFEQHPDETEYRLDDSFNMADCDVD